MKVYVCFTGYHYEGYNAPDCVFSKEEDAKEWQEKNKDNGDYVEYQEYDVE